MFSKLVLAAIATIATALPAAALPTYTSTAPFPSVDEITKLDPTPILVTSDDNSSVYRSAGFLSYVATDRNLYVDRIFYVNRREPSRVVTTTASWKQIDCGRMLIRSLMDSVFADGVTTRTGITEWGQFYSFSLAAKTCEAAASDRGMNWTWQTR